VASDRPEPCQQADCVGDLMTPKPITVAPEAPVSEVFELMHERRIRHVPVVDADGALQGIVSQRDLLSHARAGNQPTRDAWGDLRIADVMNERVDTVTPQCCAAEAARHMLRTKRGSLPVVDERGVLVGIVTEADFVRLAVRGQPPCSCVGVKSGGS
jgi:CBS domain-containing protein